MEWLKGGVISMTKVTEWSFYRNRWEGGWEKCMRKMGGFA